MTKRIPFEMMCLICATAFVLGVTVGGWLGEPAKPELRGLNFSGSATYSDGSESYCVHDGKVWRARGSGNSVICYPEDAPRTSAIKEHSDD